jgi:hypothetical protein
VDTPIKTDYGWFYFVEDPRPHPIFGPVYAMHYRRWHPGYWRFRILCLWDELRLRLWGDDDA